MLIKRAQNATIPFIGNSVVGAGRRRARRIKYWRVFPPPPRTFTVAVTYDVKFLRSLNEAAYKPLHRADVKNTVVGNQETVTRSEGTRSSSRSARRRGSRSASRSRYSSRPESWWCCRPRGGGSASGEQLCNATLYQTPRSGSITAKCPPRVLPAYALVSALNGLASTTRPLSSRPSSPSSSTVRICGYALHTQCYYF